MGAGLGRTECSPFFLAINGRFPVTGFLALSPGVAPDPRLCHLNPIRIFTSCDLTPATDGQIWLIFVATATAPSWKEKSLVCDVSDVKRSAKVEQRGKNNQDWGKRSWNVVTIPRNATIKSRRLRGRAEDWARSFWNEKQRLGLACLGLFSKFESATFLFQCREREERKKRERELKYRHAVYSKINQERKLHLGEKKHNPN